LEERVQKMIADAGLCSRRAAEELLKSGRVSVNGVPISLGGKADPERDEVRVDGRLLPARERPVYLILNKPRGYVTTMSDEKGRPTVAQLVREAGARVFPVGRLDMQSEGLLLMTNDGDLMQHWRSGEARSFCPLPSMREKTGRSAACAKNAAWS